MNVRGWLIVSGLGPSGLPPEKFKGGYTMWPDAALFSVGDWIHFLANPGPTQPSAPRAGLAVAVCVELPL